MTPSKADELFFSVSHRFGVDFYRNFQGKNFLIPRLANFLNQHRQNSNGERMMIGYLLNIIKYSITNTN
jgi:hypothetical protein